MQTHLPRNPRSRGRARSIVGAGPLRAPHRPRPACGPFVYRGAEPTRSCAVPPAGVRKVLRVRGRTVHVIRDPHRCRFPLPPATHGRSPLSSRDRFVDETPPPTPPGCPRSAARSKRSDGVAYHLGRAFHTPRTEPVRQALRRMHRKKGRRQAQARGLNWTLVERMVTAGGDSLIDVRNRALLAVAYDTLLRRSELVELRAQDVIVRRSGSHSRPLPAPPSRSRRQR